MNSKVLNSNIQLENNRVLLVPFENERNEELKGIIFNKGIWKFMGMHIINEQDFKDYLASTIKDKNNRICYFF